MRKVLAAAALAGSVALTGLAVAAPAAQASTASQTSVHNWGKYYSSNHKAYDYGYTWESHGRVYTKWYGKEFTPKYGYVWFKYYSGGSWHKFYRKWDGSYSETWSGSGIKKIFTYTCWGSPTSYCGASFRIY
ncbi:hypothetical protein ACIBHX_09880 [Nonomuraea sp. NPDC050536]|uniref:hypothetical protein n=1 Tax=Nonomuraea sp. NPDC050536 TaxID=3364366 RepID=UPI0037CB37FD